MPAIQPCHDRSTAHGVEDFSDRLPSAATTLAEVYRQAGYTTLSFN